MGDDRQSSLASIRWLPLVLIFAAGVWLRIDIASQELLWLDELHTGWSVTGGFAQMLSRSAQGNQAPLFFSLAWSVVSILGTSELTLRMVSVIAGSLTMLAAARLVWNWTHSALAAAIVAGLIAVDDTFIWYATEARPYALLHLLSVFQMGGFLRLTIRLTSPQEDRGPAKSPLAFVLLSLALLYAHYTAIFLLVSELVFLTLAIAVTRVAGTPIRNSTVGSIVGIMVAIATAASPLLWQMSQAYGQPSDWKAVASTTQFVDEQSMNFLAWFLLPITSVVVVWIFSSRDKRFPFPENSQAESDRYTRPNRSLCLATTAAVFILPCGLIGGLAETDVIPITLSRYMSSSLVAGPIFAAMILGMFEKKQLAMAGMIFLATTAILNVAANRLVVQSIRAGQIPAMRVENWPAAITKINETQSKGSHPILLFGSVIEDAGALSNRSQQFQRYLQFPVSSIYELEQDSRFIFAGPTVVTPHFDDVAVDEIIRSGGAWILVRHHRDHARSIAESLLQSLVERGIDDLPDIAEHSQQDPLIQLISIDLK